MKRLLLGSAILLSIISCEPKKESGSSNPTFSVDTVMIDSGEDLIFLQSGLSHSSLSPDQKILANFSPKSELEIIDLHDKKLQKKIAMEKEGPVGIGWPYAIQFDQSGNLICYGFNEVRVFDQDLSTMNRYDLTGETLAGLSPDMLAPFNPKITEGNTLYGIYETVEQNPLGLAVVSLDRQTVKKFPINLSEKINPYTYSLFIQGKLNNKGHEPIHLELAKNKLFISTAYSNEVIVFDLETEEIIENTFHSDLTEDQTKIPAKTSAESINEMEDLMKEGEKSVKFGPFYYDGIHQIFWRFSREFESEIEGKLNYKNVVTLFDDELNQLSESEISIDPFSKKFIKDGKLWSYVNVEDELGFAIFTFNF